MVYYGAQLTHAASSAVGDESSGRVGLIWDNHCFDDGRIIPETVRRPEEKLVFSVDLKWHKAPKCQAA
jgi:hypothetical protein